MTAHLVLVTVPAMLVVFAFTLGASLASFGCVVAERVPRGETLGGRSHCGCGRPLTAGENIPVLGWLRARGRARCCGARLPARYVLAEVGLGAATAAASVPAVLAFGTGTVPATSLLLLAAATTTVGFTVVLAACRHRP